MKKKLTLYYEGVFIVCVHLLDNFYGFVLIRALPLDYIAYRRYRISDLMTFFGCNRANALSHRRCLTKAL